jgi:RHS repeat-associated protein
MMRHVDRLGLSFHYAYDSEWRVVHAWGDQGLHDYRFAYNTVLRETEVTDSLGHTSLVKFDEDNLPLCEIDPLGGVTIFEYDDVGRTTSATDPAGMRTEFVYDDRGNLLKVKQADDSTILAMFDDANRVTEMVDPLGHCWQQSWDERGLLLEQTSPLGAKSRYEYDVFGQLAAYINPRGAGTTVTFDRYGNLSSLRDPLGRLSQFEHNGLGHLLRSTDPAGDISSYRYDAKGAVLQLDQPGGSNFYEYDAEGRLSVRIDTHGAKTKLEYFGTGLVAKRLQPDGYCVQYLYNTEEQLVAVINQRKETYQVKRDALGRVVEEIDYWGQSHKYSYDAGSRLSSSRDPLGRIINYESDRQGRIVKKTLPDPDCVGRQWHESFSYDKRGLLVELRNAHRHVLRKFDADGRLAEEVQDGFLIKHCYDQTGNRLLRTTSAGNNVACTFNLADDANSIAINDETPILIERDVLGRAITEQLSPSVGRSLNYDKAGHLTSQKVMRDQLPLFEMRYEYDRAGNQTLRHDSEFGTDLYQYDLLGNLLRHTDPLGRVMTFLNDPAGDRLQTRMLQREMQQASGGDRQTETLWTREGVQDGRHYVFDRVGNLIQSGKVGSESAGSDASMQLRWDANQRLIESHNAGQTTRYGYDPLGRRVFKRTSAHTTWFFWDGDALLGEVTQANDEPRFSHLWSGDNVFDLIAMRKKLNTLQALHTHVREYIYYPDSFVPLALIAPRGELNQSLRPESTNKTELASNRPAQAQMAPAVSAAEKQAWQPPPLSPSTVPKKENAGSLGGLGIGFGVSLGENTRLDSLTLQDNLHALPSRENPAYRLGESATLSGESAAIETLFPTTEQNSMQGTETGISAQTRITEPEWIGDAKSLRVFHYHNDPNGCPIRMTDSTGRIVWSASYSAWGAVQRMHIDAIDNPIRFQGQYHDDETGLHYNRNRYYDPHIGSFISHDPIRLIGGINLYAYAPNPSGWVDPWGWMPWMNGASARITVGDVSKVFDSVSGVGHAEIRGLKWFIEKGGGFDGQHVVISDVLGKMRPGGEMPKPVCVPCRSEIFALLKKGGAASVTIEKTTGKITTTLDPIPASRFSSIQKGVDEILAKKMKDVNARSNAAWDVVEGRTSC